MITLKQFYKAVRELKKGCVDTSQLRLRIHTSDGVKEYGPVNKEQAVQILQYEREKAADEFRRNLIMNGIGESLKKGKQKT